MELLGKKITKQGAKQISIEYNQVKRSKNVAIYEQTFLIKDKESDEIIDEFVAAYEVFEIQIQKAMDTVIGGAKMHFAEKEKISKR